MPDSSPFARKSSELSGERQLSEAQAEILHTTRQDGRHGVEAEADRDEEPAPAKIRLAVVLPDKSRHAFRLAVTDSMAKVIAAMHTELGREDFVLIDPDGIEINKFATPQILALEDDDCIDLFYRQ